MQDNFRITPRLTLNLDCGTISCGLLAEDLRRTVRAGEHTSACGAWHTGPPAHASELQARVAKYITR